MARSIVGRLAAALLLAASATVAQAQSSTLSGKVTDGEKGTPIGGANVQAVSGMTVAGKATTGDDGSYRLTGLVDGSYVVIVSRIGYAQRRTEGVTVRGATTFNVTMTEIAAKLNPIAVTATRGAQPQKQLEIPASLSVVSSETFDNKPAPTLAAYLSQTPGLSISSGGILQTNLVSRGFNNAFSGSMLMLQDYRFAGVPSLRVNIPALFPGTKDDVDRIEVLNGPASSLYGPNSANGVLHVITKSPFQSQGTTLAVEGGNQSLFRMSGRHAGVFGANKEWGYKVSGEYFSAEDFHYSDPNEPALYPSVAPAGRAGTPLVRNFGLKRSSGEARLDWKPSDEMDNTLTAGYTLFGSGLEVTTAFGGAQVKNWSYSTFQDRFRYKKTFAQVFYNGNSSGNSTPSDLNGSYYLRTGIPVVDQSTVLVGQLQQSFDLSDWKFTGGVDYINTKPRSKGTIFGRNEGATDITEMGAYLQGTYPMTKSVDLSTAIRADQNDRLFGVQFSPRVAFTWKQSPTSNWRASFSRAFNSPASFSFFLDQVSNPNQAPGFALRAIGNPPKEGWQFNRTCDATINTGLCMRSPWVAGGPGTPVSSSAATAFPGFMSQLGTIAAGLPDAAFGGAAQKAGFIAVLNGVAAPTLAAGAAPTPAQIGTVLRIGSAAVTAASVKDAIALNPSFNNTWEVGYKGIIKDRVRLSVDLWYQLRGDVGAPIGQLNPLVFYDPATLGAFLQSRLAAPLAAFFGSPAGGGLSGTALSTAVGSYITSLATVMAQLPQGSVALTNGKLAGDQSIIATYTAGIGTIDVRGFDLAVDWQIDDKWLIGATYSQQDKIVFPEIGGAVNPLMSNSAKYRASGALKYNDEGAGFGWEIGTRYMDTFPVNSGLLNSLGIPPNPTGTKLYPAVPTQVLFDASASWRLPIKERVTWSISIQNVNDNKLPTFVGTAPVGRLMMTRLQWNP